MGKQEQEEQAARLRAVREATGLTQLQFLSKLNAAAEQLGTRAYVQSLLSRLENGLQVPSFDDIAVYASIDPERRGKLWLGWGEAEDATLKRRNPTLRVAEPAPPRPTLPVSRNPAALTSAEAEKRRRRPGSK